MSEEEKKSPEDSSGQPILATNEEKSTVEHAQALEYAEKHVRAMQAFNVEKLRNENLGRHGFHAIISDVVCLISAYQRLVPLILSMFSTNILNELGNMAKDNCKALDAARHFIGEKELNSRSEEAVANIRQECDKALPTVVFYASLSSGPLKNIEEIVSQLDSFKDDARTALKSIRAAAGESGVLKQADAFAKEANNHRQISRMWVGGAGMLAFYFLAFILTGETFFGWELTFDEESSDLEKRYAIVKAMVNRVLLISVFSFGLFFCVRNYMAHRHNMIVNRHRQNALENYQVMMEASGEDSQSRDVILAHAAQCIYAPQETGFARKEKTQNQLPPVEIVRRVSDGINLAKKVDQ